MKNKKVGIEKRKTECWNCGEEIEVGYNPNYTLFDSRQVQNVCKHCERRQGIFYLCCEPDGVFYGVRENHKYIEEEMDKMISKQTEDEPSERSGAGSDGLTL